MNDDDQDSTGLLWCRASPKNAVIFALIWLGEACLILMFVKWAFHRSALLYLLLIPWALIGLVILVRPQWVMRLHRVIAKKEKRDMERLGKWTPPGFP